MNTPSRTQWPGRYRALVIDDRDPLYKMRVKVRIPDLMIADKKHVGLWDTNGLWASPSNNYLGGRNIQDTKIRHQGPDAFYQGSCLIPPKGTHVWVWFEKNDVSHPFYDGAAEYGDVQALPENQLGKNYQKKWTLLKTCQGRCIIASDDDSDARFEITGKKRLIKDPPFGDIDSVYKIDDNQTVFLIDERPSHEKILLKDYRGNFFKLIQDENGINDQFHGCIQNDVHLEFQKDFYLTVMGNMHIKVLGDIYITSLKDIFINATLKLQETALSIDRFATTYDNTFANVINNISATNINSTAAMKIFEQSVQNVRNSMITSDVSSALTTIQAGTAIGITAAGAVSIFGGGGTAIQSTPVSNPLSGFADKAEMSPTATESKPDPERYEVIELPLDAPILTTPTGKTELTGDCIDHEPVTVSQCPASKVGASGGGGSGSASSSSAGSSCGGGSSQGESSAKSGNFNNKTIQDSPSAPEPQTNVQTVEKCCSEVFKESTSDVKSATQAKEEMTKQLNEITEGVSENVYTIISGYSSDTSYEAAAQSDAPSLLSAPIFTPPTIQITTPTIQIPQTLPYTYNPNFVNNILEKSTLTYKEAYNSQIRNVSNDITGSIVNNIKTPIDDLTSMPNSLYDSLESNKNALINDYPVNLKNSIINSLNESYDSILPDKKYYQTNLLDETLKQIDNSAKQTEAELTNSLSNVMNSCIYDMTSDFTHGYVNVTITPQAEVPFVENINPLNQFTPDAVSRFTDDQCAMVRDNICGSVNQQIAKLEHEVSKSADISPITNELYMNENDLKGNLSTIQNKVDSFVNTCKNPSQIQLFTEDIDLFETMKSNLIAECNIAIQNGVMQQTQVDTRFGILNDTLNSTIQESLSPITCGVDSNIIGDELSKVNDIISNDLQKDSYSLMDDLTQFTSGVKDTFANNLNTYMTQEYNYRVNELSSRISRSINDTMYGKPHLLGADVKNARNISIAKDILPMIIEEIQSLVNDVVNEMGKPDILAKVITEEDIDSCIDEFTSNIKQHFPSVENNTAAQALEDFRQQLEITINKKRKDELAKIFDLTTSVDNQFSKYSSEEHSVPNTMGCGYVASLFLKDKYRKTLPVLTSNSGGNSFSFDLIVDPETINHKTKTIWDETSQSFIETVEYHDFYDYEAIESYKSIWDDLDNGRDIDTTTKWWDNLRELLTQCSIYDMIVIITLQNFKDPSNPFIKNVKSDHIFTSDMWRDDYEGKFLSTIFEEVKKTQCKVIYNIGRGSYDNPIDLKHQNYKIYPTCSYLRKFIMWCVYKCGITSNILSLTANDKDNLYYYSPYCEWRSFDDTENHELDDSQILITDCVDEKLNDSADIVSYEKGKMKGGYAGYMIKCSKHSILSFCMNSLNHNIPDASDINDPNIMSTIFCNNSRTALRYFKGGNYFDFQELQFDENGDVI